MDEIVAFVLEIFAELFAKGIEKLVRILRRAIPLRKRLSEKTWEIISVVLLIVSFFMLIGLFVGIALLLESGAKSVWGWILVGLNVLYLTTGIVLTLRYK